MPGVLEALVGLGGLVLPPTFDFLKKKFLGKDEDTVEATLSSLATSKPEVMADYMNAVANHLDAQTRFFNRDIAGTPSGWVINLRGAIRPGVTLLCVFALIVEMLPFPGLYLDEGTRATMCMIVSSWFGNRLFNKAGDK